MKNAPLNIIFLISSLVISGIFHISIWIKALNGWQCGICIAFGQVNACGYYIEFLGIEITPVCCNKNLRVVAIVPHVLCVGLCFTFAFAAITPENGAFVVVCTFSDVIPLSCATLSSS